MIDAQPESREQIQACLNNEQLIELGRDCKELSDPKRNYGQPYPAFAIQLEGLAEWRRRYPKTEGR
ncbi:MAG: hypothetical protein WA715_06640 [Candidatus Acidiferrum sp.]